MSKDEPSLNIAPDLIWAKEEIFTSRSLFEQVLERNPHLAPAALMAFAAALFLPALGARDFWAPGEPIYAEVIRAMYDKNDWLVPMLNGQVYADKPALYFWLALMFSKIAGGVNEWTVRLPAALGGLGLVLTTYQFGKTFYDGRTGLLAGLILATSSRMLWESRFLRLDTVLSFFLFFGFYLCLKAFTKRGSPNHYLLAYVLFALATLTKGPIGFVLPGLALLAMIALTRRWREIGQMRLISGLVVFVLVLAPWLLLLHLRGDDQWLKDFIWTHNIENYAFQPIGHVHPFYYYFLNLPPDFLPWTLLVPGALLFYYPWRERLQYPAALALACWFGAIFVFFSISKSKIAYYLLPLLPALAIFTACYLRELIAGKKLDGTHWLWTAGFLYLLASLLGLAGAALPVVAYRIEPGLFLWALTAAAVMIPAAVAMFAFLRRQRLEPFFYGLLALWLLTSVIAAAGVLPYLDRYKSPRALGEFVKWRLPADAPVYVFQSTMADFNYYAGRQEIPVIKSGEEAKKIAQATHSSYLIINEQDLDRAGLSREFQVVAEHQVGEGKWYILGLF